MASPLKVTHLDSPLRRSDSAPIEESVHSGTPRDLESAVESPEVAASAPVAAGSAAGPADSGSAKPRRRRPAGPRATPPMTASDDGRSALQDLWSPPALDERVELVSTRLPVSLARALERHTRALRDRHDVGSQKALPMQEVLAAVVWALGAPDTEDAVDRLDTIYRSYRARRMAAAAKALEPH